jgi:hypothetical protein
VDLNPTFGVLGRDDPSWLGSARGTSQAQSVALVMASFTAATHYPGGYFPSGLPLSKYTSGPNAGNYGPQTDTGASRTVTDGATTAASTTVTSATAAFTAGDAGSGISGGSIPAGATIVSVTNGTTAVISAAATATATGVSLTIAAPASGLATLAGYLLTAQAVPRNSASAIVNGPLLDTGRVIVSKLPVPVSAAAQASNPRFVHV